MKKLGLVLLALVALPCALAQTSTGTAFSVAPQLLITNQHVIDGCRSLFVVTPEGRRAASVVSSEASIDLALLRVFGMRGAVASLRNPRKVSLGEAVSVFGFPLAGTLSSNGNFTGGLVSSLQGLRNAAGEIQITAPVQPGNSGGPVLDASGLVVGVVQSKLNAVRAARITGDIPQNVNFAIALDVLANFLEVNKVPFRSSPRGGNIDIAQIAKMAQQFTYMVECEGAVPMTAPPQQTSQSLPPCVGNRSASFWTKCVGQDSLSSNAKYDGEFLDDRPHGQGTLIYNSGAKYFGQFRDGLPNGLGVFTLNNGGRYVGQFKNFLKSGKGTETYPSGAKYVGEYKDDKRNGQGTFTYPNGDIYVGGYKDDKRNGQGTFTYADGVKFVGEYKDGKKDGLVTFTSPSGEKYVGEYKDDKFHGQGTYKSASGSVYEGEFMSGEPNGQGTHTLPDGQRYVGNFNRGYYQGQGTLWGPSGNVIYTGVWVNGKPAP